VFKLAIQTQFRPLRGEVDLRMFALSYWVRLNAKRGAHREFAFSAFYFNLHGDQANAQLEHYTKRGK